MESFDIVVLGSGPGGYIAAIRCAQLAKKTGTKKRIAIVEKEKNLGGVCLNKGCIPTKAVLKAASLIHKFDHAAEFGIEAKLVKTDAGVAVKRAKGVSQKIANGVKYLMKKNNITVIEGEGVLTGSQTLMVNKNEIKFTNLIIATGAKYRTFEGLKHTGKNIIGAWEAIHLEDVPQNIGIIGAGAIGVEFAYFWNAFGRKIHIFERENQLLPIEDSEISSVLLKSFEKYQIKVSLGLSEVSVQENAKGAVVKAGKDTFQFDLVLLAVGMIGNIDGIGLEKVGIHTEKGFIKTSPLGQTNLPHIFAIGDVKGPPLLAHAASHEGVIAAEVLFGKKVKPLDPLNIPGCTYCVPEVASVGHTERALKEKGITYNVGKVPFSANGKAMASGETEGFIKVLTGKYGELLGAHIIGENATELIHEYSLHRSMEGIDEDIIHAVHPHPTLGEFLAEAVLASRNESLNT